MDNLDLTNENDASKLLESSGNWSQWCGNIDRIWFANGGNKPDWLDGLCYGPGSAWAKASAK